VPKEFDGAMWIYAQAPALAICWVFVALAITLVGSRRGLPRGVIASSVALVTVGISVFVLVTHPLWWPHFPRLVQTVQMPMRLLPFVAMITAVAVTVLLVGLGQRRARRPLMTALVIVVAAQALTAIYVVTSGHPGVALTATVMHRDDIRVEEEPSPFSGPGEVVIAQFRVLGQPKGDQKVVAGLPSTLDSQLTSDAATIRGVARVGDQISTDIVQSPLVRVSGDARIAGRSPGQTPTRPSRPSFAGSARSVCRPKAVRGSCGSDG
jgi:hypothetical protein